MWSLLVLIDLGFISPGKAFLGMPMRTGRGFDYETWGTTAMSLQLKFDAPWLIRY